MYELLEVESQRCRQNAEALGDHAGRQPSRSLRHQQAKHIKPGFLCECTESGDRAFFSMLPTAHRHFDDP